MTAYHSRQCHFDLDASPSLRPYRPNNFDLLIWIHDDAVSLLCATALPHVELPAVIVRHPEFVNSVQIRLDSQQEGRHVW